MRRTLLAAITAALALSAPVVAATTATAGQQHPASAGNLRSAPYFMPLDNDPQQAADIVANSGTKDLMLAFVLAPDGGGCTPAWDGDAGKPVDKDTQVAATVDAVRKAGGEVGVSFGGYNGTELAAACGDAGALAAAYQAVIDKYHLRFVDFDIEGDDLGNTGTETTRFAAISTLKQHNPNLTVSLTLPVTTVGLSDTGRDAIGIAIRNKTDIDLVNAMDFDYGGPAASMADSAKGVADAVKNQLRTLYSLDDDAAYRKLALTLMNGHTDQPSELFTQDTVTALVDYANSHRIGRLSYWSLNRDRQCPDQQGGWARGNCSSVPQQPYEFTKILAKFGGGTAKALAADNIPVSPYVDITYDTPKLADIAKATGQKVFTLAFAVAGAGGCNPTWGGDIPADDPRVVGEVKDLRAAGGDVIVATGGAVGAYLESTCGSADALAGAYTKALDAVGSNHLDIDVEASIPQDTVNTALATLQKERGTSVTYTLRVQADSYGVDPYSLQVLRSAAAHGVNVLVNPMVMDYPTSGPTQGDSAVTTAKSVIGQLKGIWSGRSDAELTSMLSLTPMIGVNDSGQVFTQSDAKTVVDWARQNHLGRLGFWSAGRDNGGCAGGGVKPTCSGIGQSDFEFTTLFHGFTG